MCIHSGGKDNVLTRDEPLTENNVQGCIFGLSGAFWPIFDKVRDDRVRW